MDAVSPQEAELPKQHCAHCKPASVARERGPRETRHESADVYSAARWGDDEATRTRPGRAPGGPSPPLTISSATQDDLREAGREEDRMVSAPEKRIKRGPTKALSHYARRSGARRRAPDCDGTTASWRPERRKYAPWRCQLAEARPRRRGSARYSETSRATPRRSSAGPRPLERREIAARRGVDDEVSAPASDQVRARMSLRAASRRRDAADIEVDGLRRPRARRAATDVACIRGAAAAARRSRRRHRLRSRSPARR